MLRRSGIRQEFRNRIFTWKTESLGEFRYKKNRLT